jgi:hypothetical protein
MRKPRFRLRTMMILVAFAAMLLAIVINLQRRKARFQELFSYHSVMAGPPRRQSFSPFPEVFVTAKGRWHHDLAMKYAEASERPWLPVEPDPPEPE